MNLYYMLTDRKAIKSNEVKIYLYAKNTDAIGKHFKSKLIKSYSNHHGKVRANGLLLSKKNT